MADITITLPSRREIWSHVRAMAEQHRDLGNPVIADELMTQLRSWGYRGK